MLEEWMTDELARLEEELALELSGGASFGDDRRHLNSAHRRKLRAEIAELRQALDQG